LRSGTSQPSDCLDECLFVASRYDSTPREALDDGMILADPARDFRRNSSNGVYSAQLPLNRLTTARFLVPGMGALMLLQRLVPAGLECGSWFG